MSYRSSLPDKRAILDQVLPEYRKISDAPANLEELPGYHCNFSDEKFEHFKLKAIDEERSKKYKAVDEYGNIYLVANPWACHIETREDGTLWVIHPPPKRVMTYAEAKRKAASGTNSSRSDNTHSVPPDKKLSQIDFEY